MVSVDAEEMDPCLLQLGFAEFIIMMVQPVVQTDVTEQNECIARLDGGLPKIIEQFVCIAVYMISSIAASSTQDGSYYSPPIDALQRGQVDFGLFVWYPHAEHSYSSALSRCVWRIHVARFLNMLYPPYSISQITVTESETSISSGSISRS